MSFSSLVTANPEIPAYRILANINGSTIFMSDLNLRMKILHLFNTNFNVNDSETQKLVFKQMVDETLIINDSKNYNMELSSLDVDNEIKYIEYINKWSESTLTTKVNTSGINKTAIRQYFYNQALVKKLIEQIGYMGANVSTSEVDSEYYNVLGLNGKNQYLLSEIFISSLNKPKSEALKQITSIYNNLKKGTPFARMASSFSDNIYDKNHTGEIGWVYETQISTDLNQTLASLKKGNFTAPIFINNGYYIYLLQDKKHIIYLDPNDSNAVSQVKGMLHQKISNEKARSVVGTYIENLYSHAIISYPTKL